MPTELLLSMSMEVWDFISPKNPYRDFVGFVIKNRYRDFQWRALLLVGLNRDQLAL